MFTILFNHQVYLVTDRPFFIIPQKERRMKGREGEEEKRNKEGWDREGEGERGGKREIGKETWKRRKKIWKGKELGWRTEKKEEG